MQQAWEEVLRLGYFPLEDQFYCDISNYVVNLPYKISDVRVRPTALKNGAKITVNGKEIKSAESYASKNPVLPSIFDGIGMGLGFHLMSGRNHLTGQGVGIERLLFSCHDLKNSLEVMQN